MSDSYRKIFREEALAHHTRGGLRGDVLQLTPRSFFWVHWLLLALSIAFVVFSFMGQLDEYASGPAVVRIEGRDEITSPSSAVIASVLVSPGDRVQAGDVLLRFDASPETSQLNTVEQQLSDRLAAFLRDPGDRTARDAVADLRAQRELARAGLERKLVRAVRAGVVGDVRVRAGQLVEPGMPLCTLLDASQSAGTLTALLPGQFLPMLKPGQTLRLTLDGFEKDVQGLRIERVGDQIIGPTEAARYLGRELGDAFPLTGPVVLVHARLPAGSFQSNHVAYRYYHGMHGRAEVPVRTRSILRTLMPELSGALFDGI